MSLVERLVEDAVPVIALVGAYGDGKTSILNLLELEIEKRHSVVVRFKSSLPGNSATLASTLFNSISKELHRRFFVRRLSRVLTRFARTFSGFVPSLPSGLKDVFTEPSQEDELLDLTQKLQTLPIRRVIVLLDDMDRMQDSELRMLLKIIRAADNYPKVSFVCAFNKKALVDALIRHQVIDRIALTFSPSSATASQGIVAGEIAADDTRSGYEYLEKFFPVQVPVPKLDDAQLAKEFNLRFEQFAARNGLPMDPEHAVAFDKEFNPYWKPLFRSFLTNFRKMNAYFNGLNASFVLVKREVNVIDFMFVELLRQADPEMYERVFKNRSLFYYSEWDIQRWDELSFHRDNKEKESDDHSAYDDIFRDRHGADREFDLILLSRMFPRVAKYHQPVAFGLATDMSESKADEQKRVCHPDYFMIYFSLHVEEGYVGTEELEVVIKAANQRKGGREAESYFNDYFHTLSGMKRYRFLEKMIRFAYQLEPVQTKALAIAIARESVGMAQDELGIGEFGTAARLVLILANKFRGTREITDLLKDVIAKSTTDAFAERVFRSASSTETNKIFEEWSNVFIPEIHSALAQRLRARYYPGGTDSIYSRRGWQDWEVLVSWSQEGDASADDVRS